jgi:hypothetical protein
MKKLLGTLAICALTASAFAQGTVTLGNQTGLIKQWTSATDTTLMSVPKGGGYVELIAAPAGTALANPLFTAAGTFNYSSLSGFLTANPGWVGALGPNSGTTANPALIALGAGLINGGTFTIGNAAAGASAQYLLIGWTGTFATADAAIAAWLPNTGNMFGESAVFTTGTGGAGTPATLPTNLKTTFGGMTMVANAVVPEPATFALAGLGLAALLVFRRRS